MFSVLKTSSNLFVAAQGLGLEMGAQAADDVFEIPVHDGGQIVPGIADAVIGQSILGKIVGPNLF